MIKLPFECYCIELKVHPENWQSPRASVKKDWYVYYRFYDPTYKNIPKFKKGKLVIIKGMNQFKSISERQTETQEIIVRELKRLKTYSYNPITSKMIKEVLPQMDIEPLTSFIIMPCL